MADNVVKKIDVLREKSVEVESVEEAKDIISKLETELSSISHGVGLAGVQIGIPKKVGVIKTFGKRGTDYFYLINPVVIDKSEEFTFFKEGCLSFPDFFKNTIRYRHFTIKNQKINEQNEFEEETLYFYYEDGDMNSDGLVAIAVQHEINHFEGTLIIDSDADDNLRPEPVKAGIKVGRNDPCLCGSGKKYKKCCLN